MLFRRLQTRFLFVGGLLVAATVASGLASTWAFLRIDQASGPAWRAARDLLDRAAALHFSLEREDDALLLFLSGEAARARAELTAERARGDAEFLALQLLLESRFPEHTPLRSQLQRRLQDYRLAGDALVERADQESLERYHRQVNPQLRQAVAVCDQLRDAGFHAMQTASYRMETASRRGRRFVSALSAGSFLLAIAAAAWLGRSVLGPIRQLTASVEAIRCGNFDHRVPPASTEEWSQLAAGFNRMAASLAEYHRSSLGDLLTAKTVLESTLNALPDAVMVLDPQGTLVNRNPLAQTLLEAKHCGAARHLDDLPFSPPLQALIRTALAGQQAITARTDFQNTFDAQLTGRQQRFVLTAVPIREFLPGQYGAVVVLDNITEIVRLDELRSELISVASHELKSPLTTLRMNLLMLSEGQATMSPSQRELLQAAISGCEELRLTIEELLDVTRIEAGHLRLELNTVDLGVVVTSALDAMRPRFDDAGVRLAWQRDPRPARVVGDPARLKSVLVNLLANALEYSPSGGVVRVELAFGQNAQSRSTATLCLAVTDEGPGLPEEYRQRVFEKFFRVEHHRQRRRKDFGGTGIGLFLCREIVKAHGGSIACGPGPNGCGTRVAIRLQAVE